MIDQSAGNFETVPRHTHNGLDSPRIKYSDLEGAPASTGSNWTTITKRAGPYGVSGTPVIFTDLSDYKLIKISGFADDNQSFPDLRLTLNGASTGYGVQRLTVTGTTVTGYSGGSLIYVSLYDGVAATSVMSTFSVLIANNPTKAKAGQWQSGNSNNFLRQGSFTHNNAATAISTVELTSGGIIDAASTFWVEGIS